MRIRGVGWGFEKQAFPAMVPVWQGVRRAHPCKASVEPTGAKVGDRVGCSGEDSFGVGSFGHKQSAHKANMPFLSNGLQPNCHRLQHPIAHAFSEQRQEASCPAS